MIKYNHEEQKKNLLTKEGMEMFNQVKQRFYELYELAGAVRMDKIMLSSALVVDSWDMLACVDLMIEQGLIQEFGNMRDKFTQHAIYIKKY